MEITNNLFSSLKNYFNALTKFGYKKDTDVKKLLVYNFIEELLTGNMRFYITESDYRDIDRALHCLYGSSCLIPYPQFTKSVNGINPIYKKGLFALAENGQLRHTEDLTIRIR